MLLAGFVGQQSERQAMRSIGHRHQSNSSHASEGAGLFDKSIARKSGYRFFA
jgi:hypothetical protein